MNDKSTKEKRQKIQVSMNKDDLVWLNSQACAGETRSQTLARILQSMRIHGSHSHGAAEVSVKWNSELASLDKMLTDARSLVQEMVAGDFPQNKDRVVTLEEVLQDYLSMRSLRPRSRRTYQNIIKQRLGDWLPLPITEITKQMVLQRHWEISNVSGQWKASKVQANNTMMILKLLLNYSAGRYTCKNGLPLVSMNPVSALASNKSWHRIPPRQGVIPDHKLSQWYNAVLALKNQTVRDLLLLVLFTGLRRTEAMSLSWGNIDFESRVLVVHSGVTKNHKEHRLPLPSFLYELLRKRKESSKSEWVFPGRGKHLVQCSEVMEQVRKSAEIQFSLHDLRRSFLTIAERVDTSYYVLKRLANHSGSRDVTLGYIIPDVERLRKPMQRISEQLLKLMNADQPFGKVVNFSSN